MPRPAGKPRRAPFRSLNIGVALGDTGRESAFLGPTRAT